MFSVEERDRATEWILARARADERVVAAAFVGGSAKGEADRYSDVDVTFGVDGTADEVLADWTPQLEAELDAVHLFDVVRATSVYRVFLLAGCLQVDLSFTPAADFGPRGPHFRLLFGEAGERPPAAPESPDELFGYAVHHAVRARFCIERGRLWQAEYWLSGVRDDALALACLHRGLETAYARSVDALPEEVRALLVDALPRGLEPDELLRALRVAVDGLFLVAGDVAARRVEPRLRALLA